MAAGPMKTLPGRDLFRPEAIADPGFDPSEVVEFVELVAHQDYVVCERVQRGVRSRAFTHGILAEKDSLLDAFNERYLAERGPARARTSAGTRGAVTIVRRQQ